MTINLNYLNLITLIFIIAKLYKIITWSWFWIFSPTILWLAIGISTLGVVVFFVSLLLILGFKIKRKTK